MERCALRGSTIASHSRSLDTAASNCCYSSINDFADFTALTGELIFVLDVGELIPKYGYFFPQKDAVNGEHWMWWTRSAHKLISEHYATSVGYVPNYVYSHGNVDGTGYSRPLGASPAFNVDLNSVIFSSVVSGTAGENDAEYKLTVLDELMGTEFVATNGVVSSALVGATKTDVSMRLCLTGENAENATQLSVLILDKEYQSGNSNGAKILYYDKMVVPEGMGNVEATKTALFTLPVGLKVEDWGTKYYVYVLAEDVNGKFETDYASAPHLMSKPKVSYAFPSIKAQPVGKTVPVGDIAVFTVAAQGTGTLHFQWQSRKDSTSRWSNSSQPGAKTSKLEVTALAGLHGWQFRCVITDDKGTIYSNPATLKVVPKITQQPKNATVPVSDIATFTVAATGKGPLKYQWQSRKDASTAWSNSGMPGAKTATLEVTVLAGLHGWQFRCVVTDANGMSWGSNPATLKVVPKITKQPKSTTAKAGSVATFTVAATGKGPLTYQWQSRKNASSAWSNSGQPGAKTATLEVTALAGLHGWQFRCVVTDANGMSWGSNPATLTVTK